MNRLQGPSKRERQILDLLFELGEAPAVEVHARMSNAPSFTAVRTTLKFMEDKGLVQHRTEGKRYIYRPAASVRKEGRSALGRVLNVFFGGSLEDAIAAHLSNPKVRLDPEQLQRLKDLIDAVAADTEQGDKP